MSSPLVSWGSSLFWRDTSTQPPRSGAREAADLFNCQRPACVDLHRRSRLRCALSELAASTSQEPVGSSAPSIRGGVSHRTPETPFWKPGRESPFSPSVPHRNPVYSTATRTSSCARLRSYRDGLQAAWLFSIAPSGISPCSTYRHSTISSFRASATIPMRRIRLLPLPKRRWYHWANALSG